MFAYVCLCACTCVCMCMFLSMIKNEKGIEIGIDKRQIAVTPGTVSRARTNLFGPYHADAEQWKALLVALPRPVSNQQQDMVAGTSVSSCYIKGPHQLEIKLAALSEVRRLGAVTGLLWAYLSVAGLFCGEHFADSLGKVTPFDRSLIPTNVHLLLFLYRALNLIMSWRIIIQ